MHLEMAYPKENHGTAPQRREEGCCTGEQQCLLSNSLWMQREMFSGLLSFDSVVLKL